MIENKIVKHVMVIDDDSSSNLLTRKMLENTGLVENVSLAGSAKAALDAMADNLETGRPLPEIIFLDIRMPDMDGWEFLNHFAARFGPRRQPEVVMLTGSTDTNDLIKSALQPEVDQLINKPLTDFELKRVLKEHLTERAVA